MPLPTLSKDIEEYLEVDKELFKKVEPTLDKIQELFTLEIVKPEEKTQTRYWADSTVDELRLESYAVDDSSKKKSSTGTGISIDSIIAGGVSDISSINPVNDFEKMIARRDVDLVDKAIEQMKECIIQLLNDSVKDQLYPKALACIQSLRKGCIQEEEPAAFNTFIRLIRSMNEGKRHNAFWELVSSQKISLIHEEECEESDITKEESDEVSIKQYYYCIFFFILFYTYFNNLSFWKQKLHLFQQVLYLKKKMMMLMIYLI